MRTYRFVLYTANTAAPIKQEIVIKAKSKKKAKKEFRSMYGKKLLKQVKVKRVKKHKDTVSVGYPNIFTNAA